MKNFKQIVIDVKAEVAIPTGGLTYRLWKLICYSPKWPLRLQQEQLPAEAGSFTLTVHDEHFSKKDIAFNGFIWGHGSCKVLLTHGWGSKGADFIDLISQLSAISSLQIIAFDAPGNGSSVAELSNLGLFTAAIKATIAAYGTPVILIGHSLGAMANIIALKDLMISPQLLISLTPLVKLKENFEATMTAAGVDAGGQQEFLTSFEDVVHVPAAYFDLNTLYNFDLRLNHWIFYDQHDQIAPYSYLNEFLKAHPYIKSKNYAGVGHERVIKSPRVIADIVSLLKDTFEVSSQ